MNKKNYLISTTLSLFITLFSSLSYCAGMVPQSPIVIVEESDGEGVIEIKNTDSFPNLLITKIENIEEDTSELITVFPPVARVQGNDTQTVRFLISTEEPLKVERLKRVTFEGVPPKNNALEKEINVTFKQNLPVIIRPAGLAKNNTPWTGLTWSYHGNDVVVNNPSPYVVRFISPTIELLPSHQTLTLPKSYLLPHHSMTLVPSSSTSTTRSVVGEKTIRFYPATTWGFATGKPYEAELQINP